MTTPIRHEPAAPETPAWIMWPIRAVALLVVLPFRLLYELAVLARRFVLVPLGRAVGWLLRTFLLTPLLWLLRQLLQWVLLPIWHALRWAAAALIAGIAWGLRMLLRFLLRPVGAAIVAVLVFLGRWVLLPIGRTIYNWVLAPLGHAAAWLVKAAYRWVLTPLGQAIGWASRTSYRWVLAPIGRAVVATARGLGRWVLAPIGHAITWSSRVIYRFLLRPVGLAVAFTWRYTVGALFKGVAAAGRWVRDEVLQPVGGVVRTALGLRR